jgi:hypothetical protein
MMGLPFNNEEQTSTVPDFRQIMRARMGLGAPFQGYKMEGATLPRPNQIPAPQQQPTPWGSHPGGIIAGGFNQGGVNPWGAPAPPPVQSPHQLPSNPVDFGGVPGIPQHPMGGFNPQQQNGYNQRQPQNQPYPGQKFY